MHTSIINKCIHSFIYSYIYAYICTYFILHAVIHTYILTYITCTHTYTFNFSCVINLKYTISVQYKYCIPHAFIHSYNKHVMHNAYMHMCNYKWSLQDLIGFYSALANHKSNFCQLPERRCGLSQTTTSAGSESPRGVEGYFYWGADKTTPIDWHGGRVDACLSQVVQIQKMPVGIESPTPQCAAHVLRTCLLRHAVVMERQWRS